MAVIYSMEEALSLKRIVYLGSFLTPEGKEQLRRFIRPVHPNLHLDHVTLHFGLNHDTLKNDYSSMLGKVNKLRVTGRAYNDECDALIVDTTFPSKNAYPHITVSTADGIKPFKSNALVQAAQIGDAEGITMSDFTTENFLLVLPTRVGVFGA